MRAKTILLIAVVLFTSEIIAQTYTIDPSHSTVQIQVERFGVVAVSGRFKDVAGTITYNTEDISRTNAAAIIKVASYDANNAGGEEAVKSKAFLNQGDYPEITFKSIRTVSKAGNNYLIGNLTIKDVTQEIELPFTIKGPLLDLPTQKQSIALDASIVINRQDYGINFDRMLPNGIPLVGNEVKITLLILAIAE
ncbi:MAG: YceI family protein [Saonia sp.]